MKFNTTNIAGLYEIHHDVHKDERGHFTRLFCQEELGSIDLEKTFVQANHSFNKKKGTFRGLHYQLPPFKETKIVRCITGTIMDIVVDIRKDSDTFLKNYQRELSDKNQVSLVIPEGCAHGFLTLTSDCHVIYFHSEFYQPGYEGGLHYADPALGLSFGDSIKVISERDQSFPHINDQFTGLT